MRLLALVAVAGCVSAPSAASPLADFAVCPFGAMEACEDRAVPAVVSAETPHDAVCLEASNPDGARGARVSRRVPSGELVVSYWTDGGNPLDGVVVARGDATVWSSWQDAPPSGSVVLEGAPSQGEVMVFVFDAAHVADRTDLAEAPLEVRWVAAEPGPRPLHVITLDGTEHFFSAGLLGAGGENWEIARTRFEGADFTLDLEFEKMLRAGLSYSSFLPSGAC